MTKEQLEEYKKTTKVGDIFRSGYTNILGRESFQSYRVVEVVARGPVCVIYEPGSPWHGTHRHLRDWNWSWDRVEITHKEA